ncbi:MAG: hypothetical protein IKT43_01535 [Clostridia bacterium]|nr:hypothetical protein [Clostridia bacterium]
MKFWKIFIGISLILVAVLLLLDAFGVIAPLSLFVGELTAFKIIAGLLLLIFIAARLIRGDVAAIFFPLAFLFMLFEKNIAYLCGLENEDFLNNWLVLLVALLLHVGISVLLPSTKIKKNKFAAGMSIDGSSTVAECNFGASAVYVDCATFSPARIENSFGACNVYFENVDKYEGAKTLYVENNFGAMCINVPSAWMVKTSIENSLGSYNVQKNESVDDSAPALLIAGENDLGAINVKFV